jgi:predicted ATPase
MISALDVKTKNEIFTIRVEKPYPSYECSFRINYKYFIDKFNTKCKNTEILRKRIYQLDKLKEGVNNGSNSIEEFKKFADEVSKEVSVYIFSFSSYSVSRKKEIESFDYYIKENKDLFQEDNVQIIDEIGVFFKEIDRIKFSGGFIDEDQYAELFKNSYENGIFNFSFLWKNNPEIENEFSNLICTFYEKDYKKSHKMLCEDLVTFLSNSNWKMKETYSYEFGNSAVPTNLTKAFIDSLPDFGLTSTMLQRKETNEKGRVAFNLNQFIEANHSFNENEAIIYLRKKNFFEEVYVELSKLFLKCFQANEYKINPEKLISEPVITNIHADIVKKIINLNLGIHKTTYVSSNRFSTKRAYSFNDNSDFTNLLKQVEDPRVNEKENSKKFINKWIKEFGIGDELLLKSDLETGNFKAFLRIGSNERQLADLGLGTNQLLPIILSLSIHNYYSTPVEDLITPRTVVIEEPEANLHPAMQSKLAEMFVEATNKFNVQIIAETHSEYLIRKMQYLVAKEYLHTSKDGICITNDRVNIYYINSEKDKEGRKAYEINITKNGQLTESFGKGFFDETTNLQFELYKLNNAQYN